MKSALSLILAAFVIQSASGVQTDLFAPGDGLILIDPVTGMEWLNLTVAGNKSYEEVEAGPLHTEYGFTHPTTEQVREFFAHYIGSNPMHLVASSFQELAENPQFIAALEIVAFAGAHEEISIDTTRWTFLGLTSDSIPFDPASALIVESRYRFTYDNQFSEQPILFADFSRRAGETIVDRDDPFPFHFLVRSAVPEGGEFALLLGVAGAVTLRRRRITYCER